MANRAQQDAQSGRYIKTILGFLTPQQLKGSAIVLTDEPGICSHAAAVISEQHLCHDCHSHTTPLSSAALQLFSELATKSPNSAASMPEATKVHFCCYDSIYSSSSASLFDCVSRLIGLHCTISTSLQNK